LWEEERSVSKQAERAEPKEKSREEKRALATLWFEEELRNKLIMGVRRCCQGFRYKMINEADK
jgi:hypothetical protein